MNILDDREAFPTFNALRDWIRKNRPDLNQRLYPLELDECLVVLNEETGLNLPGDVSIRDGAQQFLDALIAKQAPAPMERIAKANPAEVVA